MLLVRGNNKLHKSILCWSLPPVETCLNCSLCKKNCYALSSYRRFPAAKKAWNHNLDASKNQDFVDTIIKEISGIKTPITAVRIHVSGDFYSQEYLDKWQAIVQSLPQKRFYCYTKVKEILDFSAIEKLKNINVINSIAEDNGVNFGNMERVSFLKTLGYKICPVTLGKEVTCGLTCKVCLKSKKVGFLIHK